MAWWEGLDETRVLIAQDPSTSGKNQGSFLSLRHPRTGNKACYLCADGVLQELHWFKQSYGSWFLGDYVCEDGRLYTATPVDPVFILLPVFEEARMKKGNEAGKFRQLDEIMYIHGFPGYQSLSSVAEKAMEVVCDLKEVGSTKFFRLDDLKVLKWLCYKVQQLKQTLQTLDKNYAARDEKDTLFDAVTIIREYMKDEPWINLLCNKLKLNVEDLTKTQDVAVLPPFTGNDLGSFTSVQESNGTGKNASRTTRQQAKKAKVEKDSQNIKDMFSRVTRKRGVIYLSLVGVNFETNAGDFFFQPFQILAPDSDSPSSAEFISTFTGVFPAMTRSSIRSQDFRPMSGTFFFGTIAENPKLYGQSMINPS